MQEQKDHVFVECALSLCISRDRVTEAWAKINKIRLSPGQDRTSFGSSSMTTGVFSMTEYGTFRVGANQAPNPA